MYFIKFLDADFTMKENGCFGEVIDGFFNWPARHSSIYFQTWVPILFPTEAHHSTRGTSEDET
jgi:hypothetical protein